MASVVGVGDVEHDAVDRILEQDVASARHGVVDEHVDVCADALAHHVLERRGVLRGCVDDEQPQPLSEIRFVELPQHHRDPVSCSDYAYEASARIVPAWGCRVPTREMFRMGERLRIGVLVGMLLAAIPATASAATHLGVGGSVQQVYVTGAHPGERLALVNRRGATVATLKAGALGGLIFRGVKPGPGYRVRPAGGGAASAAVTVLTGPLRAAEHEDLRPTDPGLGLRLPDHPGRDQARDRRPAARGARAVPDAGRVLGLRLRRSGRRPERHQRDRDAARVRGRRRQHARDGVLGRRLQLLRDAPEP